MRGMLQLGFCETLPVVHRSVADELNLGNAGDRLEIRMEDRLLRLARLVVAVSIVLRYRVEVLTQGKRTRSRGSDADGLTLVIRYCCSGVTSASLKRRAPCCGIVRMGHYTVNAERTLYNACSISLSSSAERLPASTPLTSRPKCSNLDASAEAGRGRGTSSMAMAVGWGVGKEVRSRSLAHGGLFICFWIARSMWAVGVRYGHDAGYTQTSSSHR